jgi:D-alanyl-lipoteichoic acid acyltransferase DltB (MBOAT superfamily)
VLFNSLAYLIFFPAVFLLYWIVPYRTKMPLLMVASYVFYMSWKPAYGLLLFGMTAMNYWLGLMIANAAGKKFQDRNYDASEDSQQSHQPAAPKRPIVLGIGVAANLLLLGYFKYALFAGSLAEDLAKSVGGHISLSAHMHILLPLGISFFVFEFIHYLVDVYSGEPAVSSFMQFALFASFFPTQIAGPIKRFENFIPQLLSRPNLTMPTFDQGFALIITGLFKKVVLADTLAIVSQTGFPHPEYLTGLDCWLVVYAFAFQIYFDFSGYSDIAIGSARLLGFTVPENFRAPYLAQSIADFWHRWHISLSTWLRDYLFIPLGGSKRGLVRTCRNLFITMVLGGLWHGAAMHFLFWGIYHGLLLIAHRLWRLFCQRSELLKTVLDHEACKCLSMIITFHTVCLGWVFFRADDMRLAIMMLRKLLFLDRLSSSQSLLTITLPTLHSHLIFPFMIPLLMAVCFLHYLGSKPKWLDTTRQKFAQSPIAGGLYLAFLICCLITFSPETTPRFLYFQF